MKLGITDTFDKATLTGKTPEEQIDILVTWINDNISKIVQAVSGRLSISDNFLADLKDVTAIPGSSVTVVSTKVPRPIGVMCVWAEQGELPTISWSQTSSGVLLSTSSSVRQKVRLVLWGTE